MIGTHARLKPHLQTRPTPNIPASGTTAPAHCSRSGPALFVRFTPDLAEARLLLEAGDLAQERALLPLAGVLAAVLEALGVRRVAP